MSVRTDVLLWANRVLARRGSPPHVLLEIHEQSTPQQVQEAFHKIARTSHPDMHRHGLNAEELELVTSAYAAVAGAYQQMRSMVMQTMRLRAVKPEDVARVSGSVTPPDARPVTPPGGARVTTPAGLRQPDKVASGSNAPGEIRPLTRPTTPPASGETGPKPGRGPTRNDFAQPEPKPGRGPTRNDFAQPEPKPGRGPTRNDFTPPASGETGPSRPSRPGSDPAASRVGQSRPGSDPPPTRMPRAGTDSGVRMPLRPGYPRAGTGSDPPPGPASVKATGSQPPTGAPVQATPAQNTAQSMSAKALLYYRKAELCLKRGDLRGAILQLKLACAADPSSSFLRTALAEVETEVRGKP